MTWYKIIISSIIIAATLPVSALDVSCIGPKSATNFAIYLHGLDSIHPSPLEVNNRKILARIADAKNMRIALPRAQMKCPNQEQAICWGWNFDSDEIKKVLPAIMKAKDYCFASDKPFTIIGFSNGGYLLTHWYALGLKSFQVKQPLALIASGSSWNGLPIKKTNITENSKVTLIAGSDDKYASEKSKLFYDELKKLEAPVVFISFQGGHRLDEGSLMKAFTKDE